MTFVDFVQPVQRAALHKQTLLLWPERWRAFTVTCPDWDVYPYDVRIAKDIPSEKGVYAFLIQPRIAGNLNASYLMYIGQTGRTLRERFREYLLEAASPKGRPKIRMLLNLYKDYLYFACAVVGPETSPGELESELLNAFMPPMNDELPVEVRSVNLALT
jgi:hypothetical protein